MLYILFIKAFIISTIIFIKMEVCNEFYELESPRLQPWGKGYLVVVEMSKLICVHLSILLTPQKSTPGITTIPADSVDYIRYS